MNDDLTAFEPLVKVSPEEHVAQTTDLSIAEARNITEALRNMGAAFGGAAQSVESIAVQFRDLSRRMGVSAERAVDALRSMATYPQITGVDRDVQEARDSSGMVVARRYSNERYRTEEAPIEDHPQYHAIQALMELSDEERQNMLDNHDLSNEDDLPF